MVGWSWWATEISAVPAWNPYRGDSRCATAGSVSPGWLVRGGTIAFEIARQLLAADAELEFLGMIDTDADYRSLFEWESTGALVVNPAAEFDRIDALLILLPSSAPPAVRGEVAGLARARDFQRMIEVFQARSYVPAGVEGTVLERHLALRHALALSLYEYRPVGAAHQGDSILCERFLCERWIACWRDNCSRAASLT
jgi:hypothetical protein